MAGGARLQSRAGCWVVQGGEILVGREKFTKEG